MTALQIIDEIKMISSCERDKVALFLSQYSTENKDNSFKHADDSIVEEASHRILDHHAALMIKLAL